MKLRATTRFRIKNFADAIRLHSIIMIMSMSHVWPFMQACMPSTGIVMRCHNLVLVLSVAVFTLVQRTCMANTDNWISSIWISFSTYQHPARAGIQHSLGRKSPTADSVQTKRWIHRASYLGRLTDRHDTQWIHRDNSCNSILMNFYQYGRSGEFTNFLSIVVIGEFTDMLFVIKIH